MKKFISYLLIIAMLFSMAMVETFAESPEVVTQLADELYLYKNSFYSEYAKGDVNENYFVYTPNTSVTPYLAHGNDVAGAASMDRVFRLESEAGNTLIAGVNGDYYIVSNGVPIGIEIKNGEIKSNSHSEFPEIGFTSDGKTIIGRSNLQIDFKNTTRNVTFRNIHFNKGVSVDGIPTLFNSAFEANNYADWNSTNVVIEINSGSPTYGGVIKGTVKEIVNTNTAVELNDGELVLSLYDNQDPDTLYEMANFEAGDKIEVSFSMDSAWKNVTQALGGKEMLVENGTVVKNSEAGRAPRTAIGVKANGQMVLYTCDGRGFGESKGLSLTELGRRMQQLGCVTAVNLDGGVSTQVHVVYPGNTKHEQVNVDASDGLRSCANYICFKNNEKPVGDVAHLFTYPEKISVAAESEASLNIKACDSNWYPVSLDATELSYSVSNGLGTVENGKFVSGLTLGEGKLTASYGKASVDVALNVVTDWPEISASYAGGMLVGTITDPLGEGIPESRVKLTVDGEEYDFSYANGVLYALFEEMDGLLHHAVITAENSKGHISRYALSVTLVDEETEVIPASSFADVKTSDWANPYIEYLYREGIISGKTSGGKLYYSPKAKMTRQEFAVVIASWYGVDVSEYEYEELSFADNKKIASWALPYVKAAVSLGFMGGKSANGTLRFDPEGSITRQEVMTVIGKIMGNGYQSSSLSEFSDASTVASWALPYVRVLVKQGIVSGSNGKLLPNSPITREQVATIIFGVN